MLRTNALLEGNGGDARPSIGSMKKPPREEYEAMKSRVRRHKRGHKDLEAIKEEDIEDS